MRDSPTEIKSCVKIGIFMKYNLYFHFLKATRI